MWYIVSVKDVMILNDPFESLNSYTQYVTSNQLLWSCHKEYYYIDVFMKTKMSVDIFIISYKICYFCYIWL